jgi:hypothetical protein
MSNKTKPLDNPADDPLADASAQTGDAILGHVDYVGFVTYVMGLVVLVVAYL